MLLLMCNVFGQGNPTSANPQTSFIRVFLLIISVNVSMNTIIKFESIASESRPIVTMTIHVALAISRSYKSGCFYVLISARHFLGCDAALYVGAPKMWSDVSTSSDNVGS